MEIKGGTVHEITIELKILLESQEDLIQIWNNLTPLSRNEWICWVSSARKAETRRKRLLRLESDLIAGFKRPCCWPGCPHHNPKTARWFGS